MEKKTPVAVIAIGGNSLIEDQTNPQVVHQWDAVRTTAAHIANIVEAGWNAVVTHGNGPQVGFILRRNELSAHAVHTTPLSLIVADTQGSIGYMLQQAINNEFYQRKIQRHCLALVTQVRVDEHDPAFTNPTKPIGGFMDEEAAQHFKQAGWRVVEDSGRGWRRLVASPEPLEIVEGYAIEEAIALGWTVVAVGGGGIPVVRKPYGELRGQPAVIDKDLASSLLARRIDADMLIISTGVEQVSLNFGRPDQVDLDTLTLAEARRYIEAGHFAPGSMLPKIEAALRFVEESQKPEACALISNPPNLLRALNGETGTRVVKE